MQKTLAAAGVGIEGFTSAANKAFNGLVLAPALVPALAAATAGVAELGTALGVAAGAGAVFGLSAVSIFTDMLKAQKAIEVTRQSLSKLTPGTADYAVKLQQLHQQQAAFNQTFGPAAKGYDDLTNAFGKFKDATSKVTTNVLGKAFELLASVLPKLVPVSNAAGKAVGGLIDDLQKFANSGSFQKFLNTLKTSGAKNISAFGHIIGNVIAGLGSILKNFVGPGDRFTHSLENLSKKFRTWAATPGVSKGVQNFLTYVHNQGPALEKIVGQLGRVLGKLPGTFTAMGGGAPQLRAISLILGTIANLPQGAFNALVLSLTGIAIAAKATTTALAINRGITIGWAALDVVIGAAGKAALGTRIQLGLLKVQEIAMAGAAKAAAAAQFLLDAAMDANPIGLVVIAIAALVAGIIIAYKHSRTFRKIVSDDFEAIKRVVASTVNFITHTIPAAFSAVLNFIKGHWKLIASIIGGPLVAAVILVTTHISQIKSAISNLVGFITGLGGKFLSAGKTIGSKIIDGIKNGLSVVGGVASSIASGVGDALKGVINSLIDQLNNAIPNSIGKGKFSIDIPDAPIPHLASGGIVTRATTALIGEAGPEAVVPLDRAGGFGNTYHYHFDGTFIGTSKADIGRYLADAQSAYQGKGGRR